MLLPVLRSVASMDLLLLLLELGQVIVDLMGLHRLPRGDFLVR